MSLVSSAVSAGQKVLADHFNKLRQDLLNHAHGGGEGGTVDHADLGETGPMLGRTYDHSDIDAHIDSEHVHGLPGVTKIPGCGPNQVIIVAGTKTVPGSPNSEDSTIYLSEDGETPADIILDSVLSIQLTAQGPTGGIFQTGDIPEVNGSYDAVNGCFDYVMHHVDGGARASFLYFTVVGKKA